MKRMNFPGRKKQRREEAEARNEKWNELPLDSKLLILGQRPGECKKQFKKLKPDE